jgi:cytoskeleton-associated protein 5
VVSVKQIMKEFVPWFENRDKTVRTEASALVVELYRWIGKALNSSIEGLAPVQVCLLQFLNNQTDFITLTCTANLGTH